MPNPIDFHYENARAHDPCTTGHFLCTLFFFKGIYVLIIDLILLSYVRFCCSIRKKIFRAFYFGL